MASSKQNIFIKVFLFYAKGFKIINKQLTRPFSFLMLQLPMSQHDCVRCMETMSPYKSMERRCYCDKLDHLGTDSVRPAATADAREMDEIQQIDGIAAKFPKNRLIIEKKFERRRQHHYLKLLKNYIFSSPIPDRLKNFFLVFVQHEIRTKKSFKVFKHNIGCGESAKTVFIDIETEAIFCPESGKYLGYSKKGKYYIS